MATTIASCSFEHDYGETVSDPGLQGLHFFLPNPSLHPGQQERWWLLCSQLATSVKKEEVEVRAQSGG